MAERSAKPTPLSEVAPSTLESLMKSDDRGFVRPRTYTTYAEYVTHQVAKLSTLDLRSYNAAFQHELTERLRPVRALKPGGSVLCLGARSGAECKAFISLGFFAAGIDLNPGPDNRHVMAGDFHDLQFADESVDVVFTNALDHVLVLARVLNEISRVLKRGGHFIAEIVDPTIRGPGQYESYWWRDTRDVEVEILKQGFTVLQRTLFAMPWQGTQIVFVKQQESQ